MLLLITVFIFILMGVTAKQNSKLNWFSNTINVIFSPVEKFFSGIGDKIGSGLSYFGDVKEVKKENAKLKSDIDKLEKDTADLERYKQENDRLREALNLKNQFNQYDSIGGNVIAKDPGNWFDIFTVDAGTKDGVGNNYPVIAGSGLVGRVLNAGFISSKIMTIIDVDSTVSGMLTKTGDQVIIKGDLSLKEQGLCRMDYIPTDEDISVGDSVVTSGIGGYYPKGIFIGKIKEIRQTNNEFTRYAIIEPVVDFKRLEEVFILKNKNVGNTGTDGAGK
ncbi:MAG: rod shape-determining protein MreC [Bacillota bacterium]|nr:rod shape-determining protein MreC [Bacillota bacterium]